MSVWKLLSAIVATVILLVFAPYALLWLGCIHGLNGQAWLILLLTSIGLVLKMIFGDLISGEFHYYKHGYDFCVITLGASLSSLSLQLVSHKDLFPGISSTGLIAAITPNVVDQRKILLIIIFLIACLFALLTAYIGRHIKDPKTKCPNCLSFINFVLGAGLFGYYVLLLISKS
jgi:hypothetical protein